MGTASPRPGPALLDGVESGGPMNAVDAGGDVVVVAPVDGVAHGEAMALRARVCGARSLVGGRQRGDCEGVYRGIGRITVCLEMMSLVGCVVPLRCLALSCHSSLAEHPAVTPRRLSTVSRPRRPIDFDRRLPHVYPVNDDRILQNQISLFLCGDREFLYEISLPL